MTGRLTELFIGVTMSPLRETVAALATAKPYDRYLLPCIGRWGVASVMVAAGVPARRIEASDVCLLSSVVGALVDPDRSLEELQVTIPDGLGRFTAEADSDLERAAGILLTQKFLATSPRQAYTQAFRDELWGNAGPIRERLARRLEDVTGPLRGAHYDITDCRDVLAAAVDAEAGSFLYVGLPTYDKGYSKLFGEAERQLWDCRLDLVEFDITETLQVLEQLSGRPVDAVAHVHRTTDQAPVSWTKAAVLDYGDGKLDWLMTNRDHGGRVATSRRAFPTAPPRHFPVYAEQEITPASVLTFVSVDKVTASHYRDLFVHKLGAGGAERYGVLLVDGRLAAVFGVHLRDVLTGVDRWAKLVYAIGVTSYRYSRLPKLLLLALTSEGFHRWMLATWPDLQSCDILGLLSSTPSPRHEVKVDRGALKLHSRTPIKGQPGMFRLVARGPWRMGESVQDALVTWHRKYADKARAGWAA